VAAAPAGVPGGSVLSGVQERLQGAIMALVGVVPFWTSEAEQLRQQLGPLMERAAVGFTGRWWFCLRQHQ